MSEASNSPASSLSYINVIPLVLTFLPSSLTYEGPLWSHWTHKGDSGPSAYCQAS